MLTADQCVLVLVDIQGKLAQLMHDRESLFLQLQRLVKGARLFNIPIIWMEQLPDKLGPTIDELQPLLSDLQPISKHAFSCYGEPLFRDRLAATGRSQVLLCGIESHVCVYQTCVHLREADYAVHTVEDAISSRTAQNRQLGLDRMRSAGALPTSVEMILFEMQQEAAGPQFKTMAQLFR
jgi:nicotinamidase-related amidase